MPILLLFMLGALGWALWAGKIKPEQLPPVVLGIAGVLAASRGAFIAGAALIGISLAWYRGLTWRLSDLMPKKHAENQIKKARALLGAGPQDDAEEIRARHRILISQCHPDKGGDTARASALNEARDLLLAELTKREQ
jgi:DnaJ homolog subfamily C member 19